MQVRSLGYRTDLIFPAFDGQITDRGDYLVVRTPSNPTFYWGNFLLFDRPTGDGDIERWLPMAWVPDLGRSLGTGWWLLVRVDPVERVVRRGIEAVEAEDLEQCMALVHLRYSDSHGLTRDALGGHARHFFDQIDAPNLMVYQRRQTVEGNLATVTLHYRLVGNYEGVRGYILGDLQTTAVAILTLEMDPEGGWQITSLEGDHTRFL